VRIDTIRDKLKKNKLIYKVLYILSRIYIFAVKIHKKVSSPYKEKDVKVIAIGNITVGGSGKTPFTIMLAKLLSQHIPKKFLIAIHSYTSKEKDIPITAKLKRERISDEALLMYNNLSPYNIHIYIASNKKKAIKYAKQHNYKIIIFDDAIQSWYIGKDLELLLINSTIALHKEAPLPLGNLREDITNLKRFKNILLTYANLPPKPHLKKQISFIKKISPNSNIYLIDAYITDFYTIEGQKIPKDKIPKSNLIAISGIGNPQTFDLILHKENIHPIQHIKLNDHTKYTINTFNKEYTYITTEKDIVKIQQIFTNKNNKPKIIYARLMFKFRKKEEEKKLLQNIINLL